jgi:hypothetical protein
VTGHDHDDGGLHAGCVACVARVKRDQAEARWNDAPKRRVRFVCTYNLYDAAGVPFADVLEFARPLQVPADATPDEIEERYADVMDEGFWLALPDTVRLDDPETMAAFVMVEVVVGGIIPDVAAPAEPPAPSLFEALS